MRPTSAIRSDSIMESRTTFDVNAVLKPMGPSPTVTLPTLIPAQLPASAVAQERLWRLLGCGRVPSLKASVSRAVAGRRSLVLSFEPSTSPELKKQPTCCTPTCADTCVGSLQ